MIESLRCASPTPGSTCKPSPSGPRCRIESRIATRRVSSIGRSPATGRRCPLFRTSQLFPSQLRRPSREKAVVDLAIARHHSVEAELFFGALAARLSLLPPELLVVDVARQNLGEPLRVPRGNERSGDSILHQLRVSSDAAWQRREVRSPWLPEWCSRFLPSGTRA